MVCGYICIGVVVIAFLLLWGAMGSEQSELDKRERRGDKE